MVSVGCERDARVYVGRATQHVVQHRPVVHLKESSTASTFMCNHDCQAAGHLISYQAEHMGRASRQDCLLPRPLYSLLYQWDCTVLALIN